MRRLTADILAMVIFSTALGMSIEIGLAGMTVLQSLQARALAIPMNLATGRPYGIFRDWVFRVLHIGDGQTFKTGMADAISFVLFQIPLYATVLALSGASLRQIAVACMSMTLVFAIVGRPYGLFLEFCRRVLGVEKGTVVNETK